MMVHRLKVVLTVLAEKSQTTSELCINDAVPASLFELPAEVFFKDIDLVTLKEGISKLIDSKKELQHSPEEKNIPILFKVLLVIFTNTTQKERQYHLKDLLKHFHDAMTENQLKTADTSSILSKQEYRRLVRLCIPLVKLETVQIQLKKYNPTEVDQAPRLRIAIEELYECLCFPRILREKCYEIVEKKLGSKDFELQNFELHDMDKREGSLGMYAKLKILVKQQKKLQKLRLFAKFSLGKGEALSCMSEPGFKKEAFLYTVFLPFLKQMGMKSLVDFLPECYLVRPDDIFVFEDISVQGYSMLDVGDPFDLEHLLQAVKQLAKLHAASLVLEEELSESIGETARIDELYGEYVLNDPFYFTGNINVLVIQNCVNYFLKRCPEIPKKLSVEEIKEKVKKQTIDFFEVMCKSYKFRKVIGHGDTWCNNVLFQYNEERKPQSCYWIDYQFVRYCSPAFDILAFICMTTNKETRSKFMTSKLVAYYAELKAHLNEYGIDIENIYPSETFLECCETLKLAALFHSLIYLQYIMIPKDKLEEMKEDGELMNKFLSGERDLLFDEIWYHLPFRTRVKDNVEEICEICEKL